MGVQCGGDSRADARLVNTRTEHQQPPANTIIMYSKLITSTATLVLLLCLVETCGLSVDVATSLTRRTGRATPPSWRSTTPRSAPARLMDATLPACTSCLLPSCQPSPWPSSSTRRPPGQPDSPHSVPPPSL